MGIGALRLRRAALAAVGVAAGALAGCKSDCGSQYACHGVARGDMAPTSATSPTSPAFARVAAGQQMARTTVPGRMIGDETVVMTQSTPVFTPQTSTASSTPITGSGGMVYPLNYAPAAGPAMLPPTMTVPAPQMMTHQTMMMPMQQQMMHPGHHPGSTGQQSLLLINGPHGPQYLIAEVLGQVQMQPTAPVMTAPVSYAPAAAAPTIVMPAPQPEASTPPPAANVAPASAPVSPPASPPAAAPSLVAPPPASVPMPAMPPIPGPVDTSMKTPGSLPTEVSSKAPSGPVLPAADVSAPSYPVPPVASTVSGPKLPPAQRDSRRRHPRGPGVRASAAVKKGSGVFSII